MTTPLNLLEYENLAKGRLDQIAFDYYLGAACDGITLAANRRALDRLYLRPRMLVDVSRRNLELEIFGSKLKMPIVVAPTAFHGMAHKDGETATAKAAGAQGTIMCLSTLSNFTIEEVVAATEGDTWFQLYVYKDRGITKSLVERAQKAGCKAIVVTVDAPFFGRREKDVHNHFNLPKSLTIANLVEAGMGNLPADLDESGLAAYGASLYDPSLTWKDLQWLCSLTKLPVLAKGILRADDAQRATANGAAGIVVSNHGGRQLDGAIATIDALPEIVESVGSKTTILMDGGIRRGTDVLKALALGAKAVMLGRPIIWGLAVNGSQGVSHVLEILREELDLAMALAGCPDLATITADLISP